MPASAAVGVFANTSGTRWGAAGRIARDDPKPDLDSRFDLASLTKPIVATLAVMLDADTRLSLRTRIGDIAPEAASGLQRRQLGTLLRHRAGLRAWTPLMLQVDAVDAAVGWVLAGGDRGRVNLLGARPGTYSDLGYMLWGWLAERALGRPLASLLADHVFGPLGLTSFGACPGDADGVVACGLDNAAEVRLAMAQGLTLKSEAVWRRGVVQDGNARFLGGLAGHAGLFGSARDLVSLARAWRADDGPLAPTVRARVLRGVGPYALGWARRRVRGSAGPALSPAAFGHTGFTGTSLWIDPHDDRVFVLLAHRTHTDGMPNAWRRRFHALDAGPEAP